MTEDRVPTPDRPRHFVRCTRLDAACCGSCHEDEDMGYDNLYIENVEVAPDVSVGVYACCLGSDRVRSRVEKMTARLGGSGRRW